VAAKVDLAAVARIFATMSRPEIVLEQWAAWRRSCLQGGVPHLFARRPDGATYEVLCSCGHEWHGSADELRAATWEHYDEISRPRPRGNN
jgi:hypothetical protein